MTAILRVARGIQAALQPLTGARASGTATITSASGDVTVPRNSYALPVIDGEQRPNLAMKVAEGPNSDGSWTATTSGTDVAMISNLGGKRQCIPDDTSLVFDPPLSGIKSIVANGPFLGGADLSSMGALRDLVITEHAGTLPRDLSRSGLLGFPCAILAWVSDEAADGSTTTMTRRDTTLGAGKQLRKLTYQIAVITERAESSHARRTEGLEAIDQIANLLLDLHAVDGQGISHPSGLQLGRRWREVGGGPEYQKYYVYGLLVNAMTTLMRNDSRTYHPWLWTLLNVDKQLDGEPDLRLVNESKIDMAQDDLVMAALDNVAGGDNEDVNNGE